MEAKKKRVLIFSTAYLPLIGGAEVAVKEITDRLPDYEWVMITARLRPDLRESEKMGNIQVYRVGKGDVWDKFRLVFSGPKKASSLGRFDVVWSIMASYAGFAALRYKKKTGTKMLLTLQEGDSKAHIYSRVWFVWPWFKQIFAKADRVQAISKYLAAWGKEMGATCNIDVVPNGVKIQTGGSQQKRDDLKRVITVSRLVKKNGLEYLVEAMAEVNKKYSSPIVLQIIGDGELEKSLKKLAERIGLEDQRTVIFAGAVSNDVVYSQLHQADVFVRPSISEGLGNAFLEAMAMNVPVVATNVGGISDFLTDGETGLFCTHDPKDIADKILRVLNDPALSERLRTNARKMVEEKYAWNTIAEKMKNIFETV